MKIEQVRCAALVLLVAGAMPFAARCIPERELLAKVWVPDPVGSARSTSESSLDSLEWYDTPRGRTLDSAAAGEMFETVASWELNGRFANGMILRKLCDEGDRLYDSDDFSGKIAVITNNIENAFQGNGFSGPVVVGMDGAGAGNAVSVHVQIDNRKDASDYIDVVSKRYLNVDGRVFYIGIRYKADPVQVEPRVLINEEYLKEWERDIRKSTKNHRLAENGGDAKAADRAVAAELLADKSRRESGIQDLPGRDVSPSGHSRPNPILWLWCLTLPALAIIILYFAKRKGKQK